MKANLISSFVRDVITKEKKRGKIVNRQIENNLLNTSKIQPYQSNKPNPSKVEEDFFSLGAAEENKGSSETVPTGSGAFLVGAAAGVAEGAVSSPKRTPFGGASVLVGTFFTGFLFGSEVTARGLSNKSSMSLEPECFASESLAASLGDGVGSVLKDSGVSIVS